MSLEFVTGSSGAGKSCFVYQEMIQSSLENPDKQYLVIVPEQFTMQTQKEIAEMHPKQGLLNIDVLSFNRLAWRVFSEVGGNTLPVLGETGKSLIIQKVVSDNQKNIKSMSRALSRQGAISGMKSLVSELLQYQIQPEDLEEWANEQNMAHHARLAGKLEDVRTIYDAFHQYLENHYLTTEEVPEVLCGVIGNSGLVKGSRIILDGFTGFTPAQDKVVRELLRLAEKVTVVLTIDRKDRLPQARNRQNLFHMTSQMYEEVLRLAADTGTEILPTREVRMDEKSRFSGRPALGWLEKNLFRFGKKEAYPEKQDEVVIVEAQSPEKEILAAAQQIRRMIREGNGKYHYRDFAVVTGDLETYGRPAARLFSSAGIPYFLDQKKAILDNPGVEVIRAALNMISQQYSYESVFRFLRIGMAGFTEEEIDDLDNYCLACGIKGRKQYETPWRRTSAKKNGRVKRAVDPEKLLYYNELRERFVELTADFDAGMHERMGTVRRKTEVLYEFLVRIGLQEQLHAYELHFQAQGDAEREKEYSQVYRAVMDLLDKLVEVLGDEKIKFSDYQAILDAGFQELSVGLVPPGEDQVLIGDIERTRLKKIRVLFFVGVNDGIVPKPEASKGILSEADRESLEAAGAVLAPTARERMYRQRFYLYLMMTKPSEKLWLSYSVSGSDGSAKRPSYLIGMVRRLFRDMPVYVVEEAEQQDPTQRLETPEGAQAFLLEELQNIPLGTVSVQGRTLFWALRRTGHGAEVDRLLDAVRTERPSGGISAKLAEDLYGKEINMSVTRMENFSSCPCRHFLTYGLGLQEREEYVFTPADFGVLMHEALQKFSVTMEKEGMSWAALPDDERDRLADACMDAASDDWNNTILQSSVRNAYMTERLHEMMRRTVWALQEQVKRGSFQPSAFEFQFGEDGRADSMHFRLDDGARIGLQGRIDRLDECVFDGVRYVKIIDYKTGNTDLDMNQVYAGLQLQLSVYMRAALEQEQRRHPGEKAEPAGIFYYHIKDPLIDEVPEDQRKETILKELRPSGLVRSEYQVLRMLDHETESGLSSVLPAGVRIPVAGKAAESSGRNKENARARDAEEFETLFSYTDGKTREIGERMLGGETDVRPYVQYKGGQEYSACSFCPYRGICGFDERIPGYTYRRIPNKSIDEVLADMRKNHQ